MTREEAERDMAKYDRMLEIHKNDVDVCPRCGKKYYGSISKVCIRCRCYTTPYEKLSAKDRLHVDAKEAQVSGQYNTSTSVNVSTSSRPSTNTNTHINLPKCPTCQSTNVKKISFAKGYLYWRMFGFFNKTARSQWECGNCGHKW